MTSRLGAACAGCRTLAVSRSCSSSETRLPALVPRRGLLTLFPPPGDDGAWLLVPPWVPSLLRRTLSVRLTPRPCGSFPPTGLLKGVR